MKWLTALVIVFGVVVQASGLITIEGRSYGKTQKFFEIESKNQVFSISKSALNPEQRKMLEDLNWGAPISLTIPMGAVAAVTDKGMDTKKKPTR